MDKQKGFEVNRFYYYALDLIERAVPESEIMAIDMTSEYWEEMEEEIRNDEITITQFVAKMRQAKSTTAIKDAETKFGIMKKYGKTNDKDFSIKNIARDQFEFSDKMRDPKVDHTIIVTDEWDDLEDTGENVTTEQAQSNQFSSVQAMRYVHRVSCSPRQIIDSNTDVILEVVGCNKKTYVNRCHLYYRFFKGGIEYRQLLGFVEFYVGDLIKNWLKIKDISSRINRTKEENEMIKEMAKKDYYVHYMVRKHNKIRMMLDEGIIRPRELGYAPLQLEIEAELRPLAQQGILDRDTIYSFIRTYCRKEKLPTSIAGEELMTRRLDGIFKLWKNHGKVCRDIAILKHKEETKVTKEKIQGFMELSKKIVKAIDFQIDELKRYKEIYERKDDTFEQA